MLDWPEANQTSPISRSLTGDGVAAFDCQLKWTAGFLRLEVDAEFTDCICRGVGMLLVQCDCNCFVWFRPAPDVDRRFALQHGMVTDDPGKADFGEKGTAGAQQEKRDGA